MLRLLACLLNTVNLIAHPEQGQGIIEYALILFLFVVVLIVVVGALGTSLQSFYGSIAAAFP